jgi:hypothetical protein
LRIIPSLGIGLSKITILIVDKTRGRR